MVVWWEYITWFWIVILIFIYLVVGLLLGIQEADELVFQHDHIDTKWWQWVVFMIVLLYYLIWWLPHYWLFKRGR